MKVVHELGYPDQNLSHIFAQAIFEPAAHQYEETPAGGTLFLRTCIRGTLPLINLPLLLGHSGR